MQNTDNKNTAEVRIVANPHFARVLRRRLESRHPHGALRETLSQLSDQELIRVYLNNERLGREHAAKRRAEKAGSEVL
jgi:predicted flavoprotein YhiN